MLAGCGFSPTLGERALGKVLLCLFPAFMSVFCSRADPRTQMNLLKPYWELSDVSMVLTRPESLYIITVSILWWLVAILKR